MDGDVKQWLRRHLPGPVLELARLGRNSRGLHRFASAFRVRRLRSEGAPVTRAELVADLGRLGLVAGSEVMVHASLSGLGFVEGGAPTVIQAILDVIGPKGLLAMPCNPVTANSERTLESEWFETASTPCSTGKVCETFRQWPGVHRSSHPTHSVAALGERAEWLVGEHHLDETPFGPNSPYARLMAMDASIAGLGLDTRWFTFYHYFEEACDHYPVRVYGERLFEARVRRSDGTEVVVRTPRHDHDVSSTRLNNVPQTLAAVDAALTRHSDIRRGTVGRGEANLVSARGVYATLERMLEEDGQTIYCLEMLEKIKPEALVEFDPRMRVSP